MKIYNATIKDGVLRGDTDEAGVGIIFCTLYEREWKVRKTKEGTFVFCSDGKFPLEFASSVTAEDLETIDYAEE